MRIFVSTLVSVCLMGALDAAAQLRLPRTPYAEGYTLAADVTDAARPTIAQPGTEEQTPRPTQQQLWLRNTTLITGGALLIGAYGMNKWWDDGFAGGFRKQDEGWFGQSTQYGGADKIGHAWGSYAGARLFSQGFEVIGNEPATAQALGFLSAFGIMAGVEVVDGYSRKYRFSKEDAIMDLVGAGLGYLMERNPEIDRLLDFRLLYRKSAGSPWAPAGDYSGQTYLLVAKAAGVPALRQHDVLRYVELAVGYGTRGYDDPLGAKGARNLYYGISLNLSEVLGQTVFRGARERSRTQRATDLFLEFIQVPGTAALADHRL